MSCSLILCFRLEFIFFFFWSSLQLIKGTKWQRPGQQQLPTVALAIWLALMLLTDWHVSSLSTHCRCAAAETSFILKLFSLKFKWISIKRHILWIFSGTPCSHFSSDTELINECNYCSLGRLDIISFYLPTQLLYFSHGLLFMSKKSHTHNTHNCSVAATYRISYSQCDSACFEHKTIILIG